MSISCYYYKSRRAASLFTYLDSRLHRIEICLQDGSTVQKEVKVLERQTRVNRKKEEKEKKQQERSNKGVATLRTLADFSRIAEFGKNILDYLKENFMES